MIKIAITGGLSCGKSTVGRMLQELGAHVVSADEIVHRLFSPISPCYRSLIALLGEDVQSGDRIDPALVASKVFGNKELLRALEAILHPAVLEEIEKEAEHVKQSTALFVAEIPLLYEIDQAHLFDSIVAVVSKEATARKRYQSSQKGSEKDFEKRMNHQLPPSEKSARADFVIENDGSLEQLREKVLHLYQQLNPGKE